MLAVIAAIENDAQREFITKIYRNYYKIMLSKAFFIIEDQGEAEETVQDAFIKLIEHVEELMTYSDPHIYNYAITTVKNLAKNRYNKNKRENGNSFSLSDEDLDYWTSNSAALPEDLFIRSEDIKALTLVIDSLPNVDQFLIKGKYILNLSDTEIAESLHISPASVRCYLTRARRKAFALLTKQGGICNELY